jgi:hypothetical protein
MHDPMTVAFEIKSPIVTKKHIRADGSVWKYRRDLITIWHVDPWKDGVEDSCDWFGTHKTRQNGWVPCMMDDYKNSPVETRKAIDFIWYNFISNQRPWWKHPRWHFWHWKIQIHPLQRFKRWAFTRCAGCGKRFKWGYAPISTRWGGTGPRWFRSEQHLYHRKCYDNHRQTRSVVDDIVSELERRQ